LTAKNWKKNDFRLELPGTNFFAGTGFRRKKTHIHSIYSINTSMPANLKPNFQTLGKHQKQQNRQGMACSNKKAPPQSTPTPFVQPGQNPELI